MSHRPFKDRLYAEFATIGKALASAHRLELLDLLGQGERSVDELAQEIGQSLANTSAHLQVLRQALWSRRTNAASTSCTDSTPPKCSHCGAAVRPGYDQTGRDRLVGRNLPAGA